MKCYYHHQTEAVGTCKKCNKGICPDCAADSEIGLTCKGKCEKTRQSIIQRKWRRALLFALLGIFYVMLGLFWSDAVIKAWQVFIAVGLVLLVRSIEIYYSTST